MSAGPFGLRAARAMDAVLRQVSVPCKLEKCGRRATRYVAPPGVHDSTQVDQWCSDHAPVRAVKMNLEEAVHELEALIREGNNPERPSVRALQPFLPQKVCDSFGTINEKRKHCSRLEGHLGECSFDR